MLELKEFRDEMREETRYEVEEIPKSQAQINEELYGFKSEFKEEFSQFKAQNDEQMADMHSKLHAIMDLLHKMMKSKGLEPPDLVGAPLDQVTSNPDGPTLKYSASAIVLGNPVDEMLGISKALDSDEDCVDESVYDAELGMDTTVAGNPVDDKMLEDTKLIDSEEIKGNDSAIKFVDDGNNFTEMLLPKSVGKDEGIGLNEGNVVDGGVVLSLIDLQPALGSLGDTTVNGSSNGSTKAWFEGATSIIEVVLGQNAIDDVAHKVFDEMFQSIRAVLTDEQVIDPSTNGFNFINLRLFDPGGDIKNALSLSEAVVRPLIGKTQGSCANGMKGAVSSLRHALSTIVFGDKYCLIAFNHFPKISSGSHAIFDWTVDSNAHGEIFTEMELKALFEEANSELLMKMFSFVPGGCSWSPICCDPFEFDGKLGGNCLEINVEDALVQATEYGAKFFGEKLETNRLSLRHVSSLETSKHIEIFLSSVVVLLSDRGSCVTYIKNGDHDYFVKMIRNRIEYCYVRLIEKDYHLEMDDTWSLHTCYLPLDDLHDFTQLGPEAIVALVNHPHNVSTICPKVDQCGICNIIPPLSNSIVYKPYVVISRFMMDILGHVKQLTWLKSSDQWNLFWTQPRQQCNVHPYCGAFSKCNENENSLPFCYCSLRFKYKSEVNWNLDDLSGVCVSKLSMQCEFNSSTNVQKDKFISQNQMSILTNFFSFQVKNGGGCAFTCWINFSYSAYTYDGSGCSTFIRELLSLQKISVGDGSGKTINIRVFDPGGRSDHLQAWNGDAISTNIWGETFKHLARTTLEKWRLQYIYSYTNGVVGIGFVSA